MRCPECPDATMAPRMTTTGVELDECGTCHSLWFDRGEVLFFVKDPRGFAKLVSDAEAAAETTALASPAGAGALTRVRIPGGGSVHRDPKTGGIWLSGMDQQALRARDALNVRWHQGSSGADVIRFKMPNLLARTFFTLTGLYALLSAVLIGISLAGGMGPGTALAIAAGVVLVQFLIGPFIMDFFIRFAYKARKEPFEELPDHLQAFVKATCEAHRMKVPRFYVIEDLSPNAFTYGHVPNNARVVVSEGLYELLDPVEVEAVVGHEIGHARNWDMALMTLAQLVPMVLYYIYRAALSVDTDDGRAQAASKTVALGAFVLYIVSEYIVLWFSRTREYYADRFGAKAAGSAAAMGRALVKIAYGLASRDQSPGEGGKRGKVRAGAVGAMGIFDAGAAQSLAVASRPAAAPDVQAREDALGEADAPGTREEARYAIDPEALKGAMKWDLWNPWALWFELHSTHPLVAKRLLHLSEMSRQMGEEPLVEFDLPKPESFWDEFFVDMAVKIAPSLVVLAAVGAWFVAGPQVAGGLGVLAGLAMMGKLRFRYPMGSFPDFSVATLLRQVKVSNIRPVPCRLEGTVRGRGVAGLVWSDDFVMQDDTGIIFLDHRQPLSIWEMIWGWLRGDKLIGGHVLVQGWYRRAPMPFIEIERFTVDGVTRRSWLRHFRWFQAVVVLLAGVAVALFVRG